MSNPHQITRDFEKAICEYSGSKYAVAVNSCTSALLLSCAWMRQQGYDRVQMPKRSYVSVPMSAIHAGMEVSFLDLDWIGSYQLWPTPVYDSARRFTSGMYKAGQFQCVSFHASKILADTQGGAILHDDDEADIWLRKARFDGRTEGIAPKDDKFEMIGYHCYMNPDTAARLLWKLSVLPKHNEDLPNDPYPDLSLIEAFKS